MVKTDIIRNGQCQPLTTLDIRPDIGPNIDNVRDVSLSHVTPQQRTMDLPLSHSGSHNNDVISTITTCLTEKYTRVTVGCPI